MGSQKSPENRATDRSCESRETVPLIICMQLCPKKGKHEGHRHILRITGDDTTDHLHAICPKNSQKTKATDSSCESWETLPLIICMQLCPKKGKHEGHRQILRITG